MRYSEWERPGSPPLWCVIQSDLSLLSIPGVKLFSRGMVKDGHYVYMDQLEVLDSKKAWIRDAKMLPIISWDVHTPLNIEQWIQELSDHPDTSFANYILDGIHRGFRIGFDRNCSLVSADSNLHCNNPNICSIRLFGKRGSITQNVEVPYGC